MTEKDIDNLYESIINERGLNKKLEIDKHEMSRIRHQNIITLGKKLEILLKLGLIKIEKS